MKTNDEKKPETLTVKASNQLKTGAPADIEKKISGEIKMIRAKLDINASDWNKSEKEAIAKAYYEITLNATGKGRALDTGCSSCVSGAVTIIKNWLTAIGKPVKDNVARPARKVKPVVEDESEGEAGINDNEHLFAPTNKKWRKNHESISAAALELEYEFKENEVTKDQRIKALEAHIIEINK